MPAPFYNAIKGTTAGAAGTGAFTPNAASAGFRAWSTVPTGWIGLVRYEDGSAWELSYSYWNGTTLSRGTNQRVDSSTGSVLTLTSAATAAMVVDAMEVMSHLGGVPWRGWSATPGSTTVNSVGGIPAVTVTGTAAAASVSAASAFAERPRVQITSASAAAGDKAGWGTTTPLATMGAATGRGGFEFSARFGPSALPTGPRLFVGMAAATYAASTSEPGAFAQAFSIFGKDSTDTNIQFLNRGTSGFTAKIDTGIPFTANNFYEATIWGEPGGSVGGLLINLDTGAIWYGLAAAITTTGSNHMPNLYAGLGTTTGTAAVLHISHLFVRSGT